MQEMIAPDRDCILLLCKIQIQNEVTWKLQSWHDVGNIVKYLSQGGWVSTIQLWHMLGQTDQRPEATEEAVQEDTEAARDCNLSLVLRQSLTNHTETLT